jgi:predicted N-acyltransferase
MDVKLVKVVAVLVVHQLQKRQRQLKLMNILIHLDIQQFQHLNNKVQEYDQHLQLLTDSKSRKQEAEVHQIHLMNQLNHHVCLFIYHFKI